MKKRKAGLLTKIVILSFLVYAAVKLVSLQTQITDYTVERDALLQQVDAKRQSNAALSERIQTETDRDTVEDVARDRLGMVVPGEKVFIDISN